MVSYIAYRYGDNDRKYQSVHVVVREESWQEIDDDGNLVPKSVRHAWISSDPVSRKNVCERPALPGSPLTVGKNKSCVRAAGCQAGLTSPEGSPRIPK